MTSTHCPRRVWDELSARQMLGVLSGYEREHTQTPWARHAVRRLTSRTIGSAIVLAGCKRARPFVPDAIASVMPLILHMSVGPLGDGSMLFQRAIDAHVRTPPNRPVQWEEFWSTSLSLMEPILSLHNIEARCGKVTEGFEFALHGLMGTLGLFTNLCEYADTSNLLHHDPNVRRQMFEELRPLMRDVIGYPFRKPILPKWFTPDVNMLAQNAWENQDWGSLPILADALQEAGCEHEEALNHLRGPCEHYCGCWVLTEILAPRDWPA